MNWTAIIEKVKTYKKMALVVSIGLVLLLLGLSRLLSRQDNNDLALPVTSAVKKTQKVSSVQSSSLKDFSTTVIMVDIKGAIKQPAVYQVAKDARINDVVKLAGGLTEQADVKSVNLSQKVTDEMVIYVASLGENVTLVPSAATSTSQATSVTGEQAGTTSHRINLNTADLATLQTLSGIGAKRAQDIIDYREQNGQFKSVEELKNVSGFGEKTIEKLKESITVD